MNLAPAEHILNHPQMDDLIIVRVLVIHNAPVEIHRDIVPTKVVTVDTIQDLKEQTRVIQLLTLREVITPTVIPITAIPTIVAEIIALGTGRVQTQTVIAIATVVPQIAPPHGVAHQAVHHRVVGAVHQAEGEPVLVVHVDRGN